MPDLNSPANVDAAKQVREDFAGEPSHDIVVQQKRRSLIFFPLGFTQATRRRSDDWFDDRQTKHTTEERTLRSSQPADLYAQGAFSAKACHDVPLDPVYLVRFSLTHARSVTHTHTYTFQPHVLDEITLTMSLTRHGCLSLDEDDDDDEYDPGMTGIICFRRDRRCRMFVPRTP